MQLKTIGTYNGRWLAAVLQANALAGATKRRAKVYMRGESAIVILSSLPIKERST